MTRSASITLRVALATTFVVVLAIVLALYLADTFEPLAAGAITAAIMIPVALAIVPRGLGQMSAMFRALAGTVTSYRDGDFAFSLAWKRNDEMRDLVDAHNSLGDTLRQQR